MIVRLLYEICEEVGYNRISLLGKFQDVGTGYGCKYVLYLGRIFILTYGNKDNRL